MKKSFIIIFMIIASGILFAHNYLIDQRNNRFNLDISTSKYYSNQAVKASIGYTVKGRLTLNTNFSNVFYDPSRSNLHTSYGIDFSYLLLKQNYEHTPINLDINTSYDLLINNTDLANDNIILSRSHLFSIGTNISREIEFDKRFSLIPMLGIHWENESIKYLHLPADGFFGAMPTNHSLFKYSLQGIVSFDNFYAFLKIDYSSLATLDTLFELYYNTTHLGIGYIL